MSLIGIGDISRFEDAKHLVGYAGMGTRVHDSGMTTRTGKITKAGRRDLRAALVEAAHLAANSHPHFAYEVGKANRAGKSAAQFVRERMDTLGLGSELTSIPWGAKKPILLPPSKLKKESAVPNK